MNFWQDFIKLKTSIGGNREQVRYEETFGMPIEEKMRITTPNKHNKRILSQLEFAIRLSEVNDGRFDECVGQALGYLLNQMETEGVLTRTACMEAERMLLPCGDAAKEYKLILAGHAHIDMDWMWGYHETVAITLSTFRTVLNLMDQYPEFCFSQSQASVYRIVEEYDPELMAQIQEKIKEGRWEITASAWVETDKNMPNTESLLRHIRCTKDYLAEHWGIDADKLEIDFSPDTFGHSANVPEIDAFGGVKYMYHCRALDGDQSLYRWRSPSGRELLVYREQYWYNSGITPKTGLGLIDISKTCAGFKTGLIVYGVGDHGGGPTRRDIENAIEMQSWPVWPRVKFGTFREFFLEAEAVREKLPVIDRELNYFSSGCYTTQTRIKRYNRKTEAALTDAEIWTSLAGRTIHSAKHQEAWQNVLYNHFHDIITGSCVQESREYAMGNFFKAQAYANTQFRKSVNAIAASIDTSGIETDGDIGLTQAEGAGGGFGMGHHIGMPQPQSHRFNTGFNNGVPNPERGCGKTRIFHLFNSSSLSRRCVTELTVWDWVGDLRRIRFRDPQGNTLRHQLVDNDLQLFWDHQFIRVLVEADIPALGYTTVVMEEAEATAYPVYRQPQLRSEYPFDDHVLENEHIRAVFHRVTGCLISLVDKATGREYADPTRPGGLAVVNMETRSNTAWNIGRYLDIQPLAAPEQIDTVTGGDLQQSIRVHYKWGQSTMTVTAILQAGEKALRCCVDVTWNEVFGPKVTPLLIYRMPLGFKTDKFLFDIPGGALYRAPRNHDMPGLQYCAAIPGDGSALAMIPDSKYGYRAEEDCLSITLINTSRNPDPFPDRGEHVINIALAIGKDDPKALEDTASCYNRPVYFLSANSHPGTLPTEGSLLGFEARSTVLSAIVPTETEGEYHVRYYETCGREDKLVLTLRKAPAGVASVDLNGREIPSDVTVDGSTVTVSVKPNTLGQIKVTF